MYSTRKRVATVAVVVSATFATAVAYASWTASGNGLGAAKAQTMTVSVVAAAAPTADLFPGGSAGALVVKVHNGNNGPIKVTDVATDTGGTQGGCITPALTFTPGSVLTTAYTDLQRTIGSGDDATFTLPGTLTMGDASTDCQGADLTYPVTVSAVTP